MSDSLVGKTFVSVHDGRRAVCIWINGGLALTYRDRAEERIEPITPSKLKADWQEETGPATALREEEIRLVARAADQALRAIERHEPWMFWQLGSYAFVAHDPKLVEVIELYLRAR